MFGIKEISDYPGLSSQTIYTGRGDFNLTWDKLDLTKRIVRLAAEDTRTCEPWVVFLCQQAYDILKEGGKVRFLEHNRVFTKKGAPLKKVKKALPMPAIRRE